MMLARVQSAAVFCGRQSGLEMNIIANIKPVIAAAGLSFEARIVAGPGIKVIFGQSRDTYRKDLQSHVKSGVSGILSFGVAGGLSPNLRPGDVVVASAVVTASGISRPCPDWSRSLLKGLPWAHHMPVFGAAGPVISVLEKEALWSATGAGAADMESGPVAEIAALYGVPFAALRVVLDPAHRALPVSALVGTRDDGQTDPVAVVKSLIGRPGDLPALIRLADDTNKAKRGLLRSRKALGPFLGFFPAETPEFVLEMEAVQAPLQETEASCALNPVRLAESFGD
jgi:adenosylhomocysteine nucleosidase